MTNTFAPGVPMPHEAAEAAVLGAALSSVAAARGVVEELIVDDFDRDAHRHVYEAVAALLDAGSHPDAVVVTELLASWDRLDECGGPAAISALPSPECCPTPSAWPVYCEIVIRAARRRRRIDELLRELRDLGVQVTTA